MTRAGERKVDPGRTACRPCLDDGCDRHKTRYAERVAAGLCVKCPDNDVRRADPGFRLCRRHRRIRNQDCRSRRAIYRLEGKCGNCGATRDGAGDYCSKCCAVWARRNERNKQKRAARRAAESGRKIR